MTEDRTGTDAALLAAIAAELENADADEAAAIAVALGAHLSDRERAAAAAATDDATPDWEGRRWAYAGRLGRKHGRHVRVPESAPADPWAAASRADRL
jgi:hypothetical protein